MYMYTGGQTGRGIHVHVHRRSNRQRYTCTCTHEVKQAEVYMYMYTGGQTGRGIQKLKTVSPCINHVHVICNIVHVTV